MKNNNINTDKCSIFIKELEMEGFNVRSILLNGKSKDVVFDTLSHPDDMAEIITKIKNKDLYVIYSHSDWDHIQGTSALSPSQIIGSPLSEKMFQTKVNEVLLELQNENDKYKGIKILPPTHYSNEINVIKDDLFTITLHELAGHTTDSIVAFYEEEGILFAGDSIETPFPSLNEDSPLDAWIENLRKWENHKTLKMIIPSHGQIGDKTIISQNIAYLLALKNNSTINLPDNLNNFYKKVHEDNIKYSRKS